MHTIHVMHDIETLSTANDAAIISLGAVKFSPGTGEIVDRFYAAVSIESNKLLGRDISASTLMWWLDRERDVPRNAWLSETHLDLPSVLIGYAEWFGGESLPTWGNGATFDNVILRTAYDHLGMPHPWGFWHDRCYRTLKSMAPQIALVREGVYHNALDDAASQATHLCAIAAHLGEAVVL